MKRTESLYRTAVLLLLLMLAAAYTRDDDAAPGNATDLAAPLTITVTDGAYAPEASATNAATDNGAPVTRAVENGFATGFTKGDQIGLYVVDAEVYAPGNLNDLRITASNLYAQSSVHVLTHQKIPAYFHLLVILYHIKMAF